MLCKKEINVGDLVFVKDSIANGYDSGYGLVVFKRVVNLDGAVMTDFYVLWNGKISSEVNLIKLGEQWDV